MTPLFNTPTVWSAFAQGLALSFGLIVAIGAQNAFVLRQGLRREHVGSVGAQQPSGLQIWFVAGASAASLAWFSLLGFGARWLAPWFARPRAWQVLDGLIGATMWVLSALLLRHAWAGF
jgi:arginine exporter protein ArgO